ncbi:MAG: glycosyltransferase family 4 protein [Bdellovibrionota bacterium]
MKIVYASFDEVPSFKGASTHILCGLREVRKHHHVTLLSLGTQAIRPSWGIDHRPIHLPERNILRRGLNFRQRVGAAFKRLQPDLIHFRSPWEGIAAVESGRRCVYEVNGLPSVELPYSYRQVSARVLELFRTWEKLCLDGAAQIICPAARIAQHLTSEYDVSAEKITVLPNAYDPVPTGPDTPRTNGTLRMIYLGTLSSWQGILWSLKVFREFEGRVRLDIFTQPSKLASRRLERRIRRHGLQEIVRVHPPAHRIALRDLMRTYDFGFAPFLKTARNTDQGCCPLKLIDYLSHGLPVVASNLSVVREHVTHEKNGMLFHPNSFQSLRDTFSTLLSSSNPRDALREFARFSKPNTWTWTEYGTELGRIYAQL